MLLPGKQLVHAANVSTISRGVRVGGATTTFWPKLVLGGIKQPPNPCFLGLGPLYPTLPHNFKTKLTLLIS